MGLITFEDRKLVEEELARDIQENQRYGLAAFKFIYRLLYRIDSSEELKRVYDTFMNQTHSGDSSREEFASAFNQLLQMAFEYAAASDKPLLYTTGQLAAYFGVSTTTINNWLRDKRISYPGMEDKPSFKQARIPDTAIYKSTNGRETVIREVIQEYEVRKSLEPVYDEVERMKELVKIVLAFETQYGGRYEEVEARLGDPSSSDDWKWARDADEWRYAMKEIARER